MKIAVFGWYGHDNAGDERIKYCLNTFLMSLGSVSAVDFYDLHEEAIQGQTNKFDHYNLVIIGGGGLILSQKNYHEFIYGINTKIVTLGVSVERRNLDGNAKKFAQALMAKSLVILVRDEESKNKLLACGVAGNVKVSPDLTFLEPYPMISPVTEKTIGINLLPKPKKFDYSILSSVMFEWISRQASRVRLNSLLPVIDFKDLIKKLQADFRVLPIPLYCAPQSADVAMLHKSDVNFMQAYFSDVPQGFNAESIDKCKVFLSMRLHGAIFAVQKGIPIVSLAYLPKNYNFMSSVGLQDFVVSDLNYDAVNQALHKVDKEYLMIRQKMQAYCEHAKQKIRNDVIGALNLI